MLKDLNHHRGAPAQRAADIAIAGGGIAGLILATRLARAGLRVILLESGGRVAQEPDPVLSDVAFLRQPYRGALEGRARGLGGTSVKWGGALIPFHPSNFRPRPGWPRWPFGFEALAPYLSEAEALFRLGAGAYEESGGAERGFRLREAKWPRFGRRNLARLLRREIAAGDGPEIWLNAAARRVIMAEGRVAGVEAVSLTGARLTVRAPTVVLAAGALETTRLLLLLDAHCEAEGRSPLAGRAHLGRALQDHLSLAAATIDAADPARLNAFAGFRFHQGMMRSPRFELIGADGAAGFAHIAPRPLAPTGFEALRDAFRAAQRGRPDLWAILRAGMDAPYLARLAWWRLAKRRLLWPSPSAYQLHLVIEQAPDPDNRLRLGARRDPLGAPIAEIDWAPGEADARAFRKMARAFAAHWRDCGYETRFGPLVWRSAPDAIALGDLSDAGDVFHPVGTTRIGAHPAEAVVDPSLGVFGLPGLYAASTSVFPSSGGANPTMTLILLTLRLAEHLTALHRRGADALPHRRAAP